MPNKNNKLVRCPFQTDEPKISEARCVIPLILEPYELNERNFCNSWFCIFREHESKCPIMIKMKEYF